MVGPTRPLTSAAGFQLLSPNRRSRLALSQRRASGFEVGQTEPGEDLHRAPGVAGPRRPPLAAPGQGEALAVRGDQLLAA